jgi:preprotein translocase subunit YajC
MSTNIVGSKMSQILAELVLCVAFFSVLHFCSSKRGEKRGKKRNKKGKTAS